MRMRSLVWLPAVLAVLGHASPAAAQAGGLWWSYSVKFVCGVQPRTTLPGEPPVTPGNYATEINIHNPFYLPNGNEIRKKVVFLVKDGQPIGREPQPDVPIGRVPKAFIHSAGREPGVAAKHRGRRRDKILHQHTFAHERRWEFARFRKRASPNSK